MTARLPPAKRLFRTTTLADKIDHILFDYGVSFKVEEARTRILAAVKEGRPTSKDVLDPLFKAGLIVYEPGSAEAAERIVREALDGPIIVWGGHE